jgi:hypothetical protein
MEAPTTEAGRQFVDDLMVEFYEDYHADHGAADFNRESAIQRATVTARVVRIEAEARAPLQAQLELSAFSATVADDARRDLMTDAEIRAERRRHIEIAEDLCRQRDAAIARADQAESQLDLLQDQIAALSEALRALRSFVLSGELLSDTEEAQIDALLSDPAQAGRDWRASVAAEAVETERARLREAVEGQGGWATNGETLPTVLIGKDDVLALIGDSPAGECFMCDRHPAGHHSPLVLAPSDAPQDGET